MFSPSKCDGPWDCIVKLSKFLLWIGGGVFSVGTILVGLHMVDQLNMASFNRYKGDITKY